MSSRAMVHTQDQRADHVMTVVAVDHDTTSTLRDATG